eukprot:785041-Prymnesium_polylepis.2
MPSGTSPITSRPVPAGRFFCQSGRRDAASLDSDTGAMCAHLQSAPRVHCERARSSSVRCKSRARSVMRARQQPRAARMCTVAEPV